MERPPNADVPAVDEEEDDKDYPNETEEVSAPLLTTDPLEFPLALLDAIKNHDRSHVERIMSICKCKKNDSQAKFLPCGGWLPVDYPLNRLPLSHCPQRAVPIEVYLAFRTKEDVPLLSLVLRISVKRLNDAIGKEVLVIVDKPTKLVSSDGRKPLVTVRLSLDHKHGRGHAITKWEPKWNSALRLKLDKTIIIPLCMRKKDDQPLRRRTFAYYSTMTHELVHCLGMAHFPKLEEFSKEIVFPCSGGTLIPAIPDEKKDLLPVEDEFPLLKKSPLTIRALRWVYANPLKDTPGMPVYCDKCKELGWLW